MRILVLDNYDSFTYNIVHILRELGGLEISVIKNDLRKNAYFYPVNLKQAQTQGRTDGYIFAYIRYGGKVMMPAYGRINEQEAWDIVYYVRYLQGKVK